MRTSQIRGSQTEERREKGPKADLGFLESNEHAGVVFAFFSCGGLFAAVQLMMEYREEERRRGIWRKY